jgi:hypothetical protein
LPRLMLRTSLAFIGRRGATAFVISLCRRKIRFHWCGKTIAYRAAIGNADVQLLPPTTTK